MARPGEDGQDRLVPQITQRRLGTVRTGTVLTARSCTSFSSKEYVSVSIHIL